MHRIIHLLALLAALATAAVGLVAAAPASAGPMPYSLGVKDVDYFPAADSCAPEFFSCTPNAGEGPSNVLRITQEPAPGGGLEFAGHETTAAHPDKVWLAATIAAECRVGYHLRHASIGAGAVYSSDNYSGPPAQVTDPEPWYWASSISVPSAKAMPSKMVALNVPVQRLFDADGGGSMLTDFDSMEELYAHGESVIAQRVAGGMTQGAARAEGFEVHTWVATHAAVACEGNISGNLVSVKRMPAWLPLTIQFVPEAQAPVGPQAAGGGDVAVAPEVTHTSLSVAPTAGDECSLTLTATFVATADTPVTYRIIDPYGRPSTPFLTEVPGLLLTVVHHEVPIPTAAPTGTTGIHVEAGGAPTGNFAGTMQLEVTAPNGLMSNHAGFDVPPCPGQVNEDLDPLDGLAGGATPTHGPAPMDGVSTASPTSPVPPVPPAPTRPQQAGGLVAPATTTTTVPAPSTWGGVGTVSAIG